MSNDTGVMIKQVVKILKKRFTNLSVEETVDIAVEIVKVLEQP